jgi:sortase A
MIGSRRGIGFILVGLLLLAGAAGLIVYNYWDSERAGKEAQEATFALEEVIDRNIEDGSGTEKTDDLPKEMPVEEIDGYEYIGVIEIPSQDIRLSVMNEWDYERLKVSPCRYSGSYYTDDLVICGHNYSKHFSPVRWVSLGDDVYFTNVTGEAYHYTVSNIETVEPTQISEMIENENNSDSQSDWDLTLFTCNIGGQTRCAVRCVREEE